VGPGVRWARKARAFSYITASRSAIGCQMFTLGLKETCD
jgi:hypothetical protein